MKKIILTGATGFIGSHFAEHLTSKGIEVLALGRKSFSEISDLRKKRLSQCTYLQLSMCDITLLSEVISKIGWSVGEDCVFFNLAWGGKDKLSDLDINAQLLNVSWSYRALESAKQVGCNRFIHMGTMEEAFTYKYLDLDHHNNTEFNRHVIYSTAKIASKNALKLRSSELGMDFIHVLHSHVMGPDDDKDSFLQVTLQKLISGQPLVFSSGEQTFDVISLFDCCEGYFLIATSGQPGAEYWVGSGDPQPLKNYVERMYAMYPSNQPMQFGAMPFNDVRLSYSDFSITRLQQDTGYAPAHSFEETVQQLYNHLISLQ